MKVVRQTDAPHYDAPGHSGFEMKRLQGLEASDAHFAWMGLSRLAPGGHTDLKASDAEKIYLVLEGDIEFTDGETTVAVGMLDSVHFPRGARRQLRNTSAVSDALVVLVMERP
ncbi:MAG: cupin domain-containing protein [Pseudomonadota bacterium]